VKIHFWGVRGSLPTPLLPEQIQSKIMAVIQRIQPSDLESEESRAKFAAQLPDYIMGTSGGNTPCVELQDDKTEIILDAGTGIRVLGKNASSMVSNHVHLFLSHFHWDHIQGLPFFDLAYNPSAVFDVYSFSDKTKEFLQRQMSQPFYPVPFESFTKKFTFHNVTDLEEFKIDKLTVNYCKMSHPGSSYSYSFERDGKKIVYATDVELKSQDYISTPETDRVFKNADVIILDSQYTVEEAYRKENWGHSAFCYAIDFAEAWKIKKMFMFHHEPTYDDRKLNTILESARWYANYVSGGNLEIDVACEGTSFDM